jgi:hypothetical protein
MFGFLTKRTNKALLGVLFVLGLFAFISCSESSSDSGSTLPLSSPKSVQVTPKDTSLLLQWTKVADAQGVPATYKVFINTADDAAASEVSSVTPNIAGNLVTATISEFGGSPLANDTRYFVWVKAYFGSNEAPFSPVTFGTPVPPAEKPAVVYPTIGDQILWLQWEESPHAFSYDIAYSETDGATPSGTVTTKTVSSPYAVLTELNNTTTYYIWVRATNTAGISNWEKISSIPAAAGTAPSTPIISSVIPGNKRLTVAWNSDPSATSYEVQWTDGTNNGTLSVAPEIGSVSVKISGLVNGAKYTVKVVAANTAGDSYSIERTGSPVADTASVDFDNFEFLLGNAAGEFIFAELLPKSPIFVNGRDSDRLTRFKETALGNLFTDGVAWYVRENFEDIDFVLLNGGFIDNALTTGPVTVGTLLGITEPDSREDTITILTLNGSDLKDLFTFMADVVHTGRGSSGTGAWGVVSEEVRYTIRYPHFTPEEIAGNVEISREDSEPYYHGIIEDGSLTIHGVPIDDNTPYRIATTSYLATGHEGYLALARGRDVENTGIPFWQGVGEYIFDQKNITPYLDGRIGIYGGVPLAGPQAPYNDPSYIFP